MSVQKIRVRKTNGHEYAELAESYYDPDKKSSRYRYLGYLGKVVGHEENGDPILEKDLKVESIFFPNILISEAKITGDSNLLSLIEAIYNGSKFEKKDKVSKQQIPLSKFTYFSEKSTLFTGYYDIILHNSKITVLLNKLRISELIEKCNCLINFGNKLQQNQSSFTSSITISQTNIPSKEINTVFNRNITTSFRYKNYIFSFNYPENNSIRDASIILMLRIIIDFVENKLKKISIDPFSIPRSVQKLIEFIFHVALTKVPKLIENDNLESLVLILIDNGFLIKDGKNCICGCAV